MKFLNGVARSYGYQVFGDSDIDGHSAAISSGPGDGSDTGRRLLFLTNISSALKMHLMDHCVCLIYPPANEHFGIVSWGFCVNYSDGKFGLYGGGSVFR